MMGYINDGWHLSGDKTPESERREDPQDSNVKFVQTRRSYSPSGFTNFRLLGIRALHNIAEDEELFVDNGTKYDFNNSNL